jgi:uncharacterized PurR-regulated membrane protein YhhQ (DUF165 family)
MRTTILYLLSIVSVNWLFAHTEPIWGIPPATFLVGLVFVLRDYVQRQIGHKVLLVMLLGCGISFFMASPIVATASLTAFLAAEASDWGIYTVLPYRFHHRVLASSVIGVAVDTMVFLPMIGLFSWQAAAVMWASKMVAAMLVWSYYEVVA